LVAYSKYNAVVYFVTYQAVIFVCLAGNTLNMMWGGFGAALCWLLALLLENQTEVAQQQESSADLEALLLEKPAKATADVADNNDSRWERAMPKAIPCAFIVMGMTLLSAVDDMYYFTPVMEKDGLVPVLVGSILTIALWTCLALLVANSRCRTQLAKVPFGFILGIYAGVMTGRRLGLVVLFFQQVASASVPFLKPFLPIH